MKTLTLKKDSFKSLAETKFSIHLEEKNIPYTREYRFDETRRFRLDFAIPSLKIGIEIEGLTREGGRHQKPIGFMKDCEKYNLAAFNGWRIFRVPSWWLMSAAYFDEFNIFMENLKKFISTLQDARVLPS